MSKRPATVNADDIEERAVPDPSKVKRVRVAAGRLWQLKKKAAEISIELQTIANEISVLEEGTIPEAMRDIGVRSFPLSEGYSLKLERAVNASISEANAPVAFEWLSIRKFQIVKTLVTVAFGKNEVKFLRKFLLDLSRRKRKLDIAVEEKVHAKTLRNFVRDRLDLERSGQVAPDNVLPRDVFGVYEATRAELIGPEESTTKGKA